VTVIFPGVSLSAAWEEEEDEKEVIVDEEYD
jgi:hypothetical protein